MVTPLSLWVTTNTSFIMGVNLLTFCYVILGGGGKIGECIATELAKENVTLVLWDVNESKFRVLGVV